MFNFKRPPKVKKLENLDLLEVNLIKDTPLEFAYLMPKSNRVIQKINKESITKIILEDPKSVQYVKLGKEKSFELTASLTEFKGVYSEQKRKKAVGGLIQNSIIILILVLTFTFQYEKDEFQESKLLVIILAFIISTTVVHIYQLNKNKREKK